MLLRGIFWERHFKCLLLWLSCFFLILLTDFVLFVSVQSSLDIWKFMTLLASWWMVPIFFFLYKRHSLFHLMILALILLCLILTWLTLFSFGQHLSYIYLSIHLLFSLAVFIYSWCLSYRKRTTGFYYLTLPSIFCSIFPCFCIFHFFPLTELDKISWVLGCSFHFSSSGFKDLYIISLWVHWVKQKP